MQPNYNNQRQPSWTNLSDERQRNRQQMRPDHSGGPKPIIDWQELFVRIKEGLKRLWIAFRFYISGKLPATTAAGSAFRFRMPWFKFALMGAVVFFFLQKDIQFTIRLNAPLAFASHTETASGVTEQMGLAQPINFSSRKANKSAVKSARLDAGAAKNYINRFARVARTEMQKYDVPASIKMAQALLESNAGRAAGKSHNHFGEPLAGETFESAWANWRAHSLLLRRNYPDIFSSAGLSYKAWAKALEKTAYGADPAYAEKLVKIIEDFKLYQLDEDPY